MSRGVPVVLWTPPDATLMGTMQGSIRRGPRRARALLLTFLESTPKNPAKTQKSANR